MSASIRNNKTEEVVSTFDSIAMAIAHFYNDGRSAKEFYISDEDWRLREGKRTNLVDLSEFGLTPIVDHFVHIGRTNDPDASALTVSYTENEGKGRRDRQASGTRIGSYLKRFYPDLTSVQVEELSNKITAKYNRLELKFASTREEIRDVYLRSRDGQGTDSCMTRLANAWDLKDGVHPVEAYAGGDLQVAYIEREGRIIARAVVWPEKKQYNRVYGGEYYKLITTLEAEGYEQVSTFSGARLALIDGVKRNLGSRTAFFVFPYIDTEDYVVVEADCLRLVTRDQLTGAPCSVGGHTGGGAWFEKAQCHVTHQDIAFGAEITVREPHYGDRRIISNDVLAQCIEFDGTYYLNTTNYKDSFWDTPEGIMPRCLAVNKYAKCTATNTIIPLGRAVAAYPIYDQVSIEYFVEHLAPCGLTGRIYRRNGLIPTTHGQFWSQEALIQFPEFRLEQSQDLAA